MYYIPPYLTVFVSLELRGHSFIVKLTVSLLLKVIFLLIDSSIREIVNLNSIFGKQKEVGSQLYDATSYDIHFGIHIVVIPSVFDAY